MVPHPAPNNQVWWDVTGFVENQEFKATLAFQASLCYMSPFLTLSRPSQQEDSGSHAI